MNTLSLQQESQNVNEQMPRGRTIRKTDTVSIALTFFDAVSARFYGCSGLQRDVTTVVAKALYEQAKLDGHRCKVVKEPNGEISVHIGYGRIAMQMPVKAVA